MLKKIKYSSVLLLCLSFSLLEAREFYSAQAANNILNQEKVSQQLNDFKNNSSAQARVQLLSQWQLTQNIEPLVQDKLLYSATLILRQSALSDPIELATYQKAMTKLLTYQSKAYIPLQDGAHELQVVAFEIAASAKATLLHWQIEETFNHSKQLLKHQPPEFLSELSLLQQPLEKQLGHIKAINQATQTELASLTQNVIQNQSVLPLRVMQALAIKTADHQLYKMLIEQYVHSTEQQALMLNTLSRLPLSMSSEQRIELLLDATSKPELRNTAIINLAPFVDTELNVKDFLNTELSSKINGGAAAKALSLSGDSLTIEMLGRNLKHDNPLIVRRSLLALYLNKGYQAKLLLREFQQTTLNAQLKQEVSQWLK